jgi:general secretion pathway protein K
MVLWAILLLGTVVGTFAVAMRTEAQTTRNGYDGMRAYYKARAGMSRAMALLAVLPLDNVLATPIRQGDRKDGYSVTLSPESGKIDINHVQEDVLKEVLRKGGLSADDAERIGDAILDWRDPDGDRRPHGAEREEYDTLPHRVLPRNGNVEAVEELQTVQGITPELYRSLIGRIFTVHGGGPSVNVNAAPGKVLRVLPGMTEEAARAVEERRKTEPFRSPGDLAAVLNTSGAAASAVRFLTTVNSSRVVSITAVGSAEGEATRAVGALVETTQVQGRSVRILRWKDQADVDEGA